MFSILNLLSSAASGGASGSTSGTATQGNPYMQWIFLGAIAVILVVYFIFSSRSRKKQQEQIEEKMSKLKKGDKIKTIGMIIGEIVEVNEDGTYLIMTGNAECFSYMTIDKQAIYQIIEAKQEEPAAEPFGETTEAAEDSETTEATPATEEAEATEENEEHTEKAVETVEEKTEG